MKVTARTRDWLACRRDRRDMIRQGWEYVGEGGGRLWELYRGGRSGHRIVEAKVARDGMGIWVLIEDHSAELTARQLAETDL